MYKIVRKKELNAAVTYMEIEAPFVARKAKGRSVYHFPCRREIGARAADDCGL